MKYVWNFIQRRDMKFLNISYMIRAWNVCEISYDAYFMKFHTISYMVHAWFFYLFILSMKKHETYMNHTWFIYENDLFFHTGSHISSDRQWKKLVSKLLAHQVLSTLLYAVKKLEVRLRGSSPEMATVLHQWADGCLVKVKDALWR